MKAEGEGEERVEEGDAGGEEGEGGCVDGGLEEGWAGKDGGKGEGRAGERERGGTTGEGEGNEFELTSVHREHLNVDVDLAPGVKLCLDHGFERVLERLAELLYTPERDEGDGEEGGKEEKGQLELTSPRSFPLFIPSLHQPISLTAKTPLAKKQPDSLIPPSPLPPLTSRPRSHGDLNIDDRPIKERPSPQPRLLRSMHRGSHRSQPVRAGSASVRG